MNGIYDIVDKNGKLTKFENEMKQREIKDRSAPLIPKSVSTAPQKQPPLPATNCPPQSVYIAPSNKPNLPMPDRPPLHPSPRPLSLLAPVAPSVSSKSKPASKPAPATEDPHGELISEIGKFDPKKLKAIASNEEIDIVKKDNSQIVSGNNSPPLIKFYSLRSVASLNTFDMKVKTDRFSNTFDKNISYDESALAKKDNSYIVSVNNSPPLIKPRKLKSNLSSNTFDRKVKTEGPSKTLIENEVKLIEITDGEPTAIPTNDPPDFKFQVVKPIKIPPKLLPKPVYNRNRTENPRKFDEVKTMPNDGMVSNRRQFTNNLNMMVNNINMRQDLENKLKNTSETIEYFTQILLDRDFQYTETLLNRLSKDFLSQNISKEIINTAISQNNLKLIKALFDKANVDVQNEILEDILFYHALNENEDDFETCLNYKLVSTKYFENGENLLTNLIKNNKTKFVWKLLSSNIKNLYINLKNSKLQSPLQVAIEMNLLDITSHLICESDKINNEDENRMTALEQIFEKFTDSTNLHLKDKLKSIAKSIVNNGGDIYKQTSKGHKVIDLYRTTPIGIEIENYYKSINRLSNDVDKNICSICFVNDLDCVFDCGHTFCMTCGEQMSFCPVCRSEYTNPKRIFLN